MIFYFTGSTCSLASHIALEEAGADFEPRAVKLWEPQAAQAYRAINPKGSVPALQVGERLITENVAIQYYVAKSFPEAQLLPDDVEGQAQVLSLAAWFSSSVHIARRQLRAPFRFTPDETAHPALKAAGEKAFADYLRQIDGLLEGRTWLCGERLTTADGYALVFYDWGVRDGLAMAELRNFTRLKERLVERPAVRRALQRERSVLLPENAPARA